MEKMTENQNVNSKARSLDSILETCRNMIQSLHLELSAEGRDNDGKVCVNLSGQDRPYLLSNSAAVLNSIEYILNRIYRFGKEDRTGIVMDSDGYRQHREAELILLAQMASQKVISMRMPLGLQPMTPRERRIVHLALAEIEGVNTKSSGEGDHRSITIFPS